MSERQIKESQEDTDKVGRGPNIPDDWKKYIMEQAIKESLKPRMLLADAMLKEMRQSRDVGDKLPERESIAKLISKTRTHKTSDDSPWSLGVSKTLDISPEATADLLKVWKCCLAIGHTLTIREAKWVALIRTAIETEVNPSKNNLNPDSNNHQIKPNPWKYRGVLLFGFAYEYAIRERIAEISGSPMDTRDLDGGLCFQDRDWVWVVFRALGIIPRLTTTYFNEKLSEYDYFHIYFNPASVVVDKICRSIDPNEIKNLALELTEEQSYMFAALLTFLSKGPLWKEIPPGDHEPIFNYLKELVMKELADISEYVVSRTDVYEGLDLSQWRDRPKGLEPEDVLYPDLLKLAGYKVTTHTETVDRPNSFRKDDLVDLNYPGGKRYKAVFNLKLG
jgi:predicted transcriptional regulator